MYRNRNLNYNTLLTLLLLLLARLAHKPHPDSLNTTTGESPLSIRFAPSQLHFRGCELAAILKIPHLRKHAARHPSLHILISFLLLCGDIELNPGPRNWKFPCGG